MCVQPCLQLYCIHLTLPWLVYSAPGGPHSSRVYLQPWLNILYLDHLIKLFRITRNFQTGVLELYTAVKEALKDQDISPWICAIQLTIVTQHHHTLSLMPSAVFFWLQNLGYQASLLFSRQQSQNILSFFRHCWLEVVFYYSRLSLLKSSLFTNNGRKQSAKYPHFAKNTLELHPLDLISKRPNILCELKSQFILDVSMYLS